MDHYKICVYAICKNEEQFVDRWMDAVSEADAVIVLDTGSTDATVEKLRLRGAFVYEETILPWRFDTARNAALDHVPEDADICVANDLDEIFEPGWREKLESKWRPEYTRARYQFAWSHHPDGSVSKQYPMEKIHRRQGYRWVHPVHEILKYSGEGGERFVWINDIVLHHYPDLSKPRSQYLPLLELSVKENPEDDRAMFWLGREYVFYEKHDLAIKTLRQYLELPSALWREERSAAMRFIGRCYEAKGDSENAKAWLYRAVAECPEVREPYLSLVRFGYAKENWTMVYAMALAGLTVTHNSGSYLVQPESWGCTLYDYAAIGAYNLEMYDKAREYAAEACRLEPENARLKSNLDLIEKKISSHAEKGDQV